MDGPLGETVFISRGYGGRTTDTEIIVQSGFLDLIKVGDVILAATAHRSPTASLSVACSVSFYFPEMTAENGFDVSGASEAALWPTFPLWWGKDSRMK